MNNGIEKKMEYKGYRGTVEYSQEDGWFYGKVEDIRSLISYEASTADKLRIEF